MPPLTKRQKQAKQQRASSAKCFSNALIEDLLEVYLDPDYLPETDGKSDTDSNSSDSDSRTLSFSLIDEVEEVSDGNSESTSDCEASMETMVNITGEKRKEREDILDILAAFEAEETVDFAEKCARRAAVSAQKFWAGIMGSVSNVNFTVIYIEAYTRGSYRKA